MRIAIIVEGIPDAMVCKYLAERLKPDLVVRAFPLGKKPDLIKKCGQTAKDLLKDGYEKVVIVWDLQPAEWQTVRTSKRQAKQKQKTKACIKLDRDRILTALQNAGTDPARIHLVCIDAMLETWLLRDKRAAEILLTTETRPYRIGQRLRLDREKDPKSLLTNIFRDAGRRGRKPYNDTADAIKIARSIPSEPDDLKRLKRDKTFRRFLSALLS